MAKKEPVIVKDLSVDEGILTEHKSRGDNLSTLYTTRDSNADKYIKMYLMQDTDTDTTEDGTVWTVSADPRVKLLAAKRLLTTTVPKPSIINDDKTIMNADQLEKAARYIMFQSGRLAQMPLHYAAVESALLYGEVHLALSSTAAMLAIASEGYKTRAERLAALTPHIIEVWNPRHGYPEYDSFGQSGYLRKVMLTVKDIESRFGDASLQWAQGKTATDKYELMIFYDDVNWSAWVEDTGFVAQAHELPSFPIVATLTDGSALFEKPEEQRQPFLYGLEKSGMWKRQNLALTVLYTNIFNMGMNAIYKHTAPPGNPSKTFTFNSTKAGGVIDLEPGETLEPMITKGIIDPSFQVGMDIANKSSEESTMYSQALGQPMQGSAAYATISLLSQSGRLPLVTTQKMVEQAFSIALEKCFAWYKEDNKALKGWPVKPSEIPADLQINCKMDVDLPQDKMQLANTASMLIDKGITDREWVRQNVLNVEEAESMDEKIAEDRFFEGMVAAYMEAEVPTLVKQLMAAATPPGDQNVVGTEASMKEAPTGIGPDELPGPEMNQQAALEQQMAQQQAMQQDPNAQNMPLPSEAELSGAGMDTAMGGSSGVAGGMNLDPNKLRR